MSKGLEALEWLTNRSYMANRGNEQEIEEQNKKTKKSSSTIEKELKALEIIKNKECIFKGLSETTQEEYELLKEVLL